VTGVTPESGALFEACGVDFILSQRIRDLPRDSSRLEGLVGVFGCIIWLVWEGRGRRGWEGVVSVVRVFLAGIDPREDSVELARETARSVARSLARSRCWLVRSFVCSAAAWDTVEELSAAVSHSKAGGPEDPLEKFCEEDPSADECRVYED